MSPDQLPTAPAQPSSARRRLLKGVMAGAAVLPVGAGATSVASNLRCLKNTVDPGVEPTELVGGRAADKLAMDNISRVPLYKSTKDTKTRYWVKGSDLVALQGTAPISVPSGVTATNWLLSSSDNGDTVPDLSSAPESHGGSGWSTPVQDGSGLNRYVAVRFDNAGNMVGTSDYITNFSSPKNNSAIHRTCWSSFSGVNFTSLG
jgi:hypothetical protein